MAELEAETGKSFDVLRSALAANKRNVRSHWDDYIAEFTRNAERLGSTVIFATTVGDAVEEIRRICVRHDATLMVKGKSMASEEIDLNARLSECGVTAVETDLGEWLLQLSDDHPSHLVMPIIHRRRHQIAQILENALGRKFDPDDIATMVKSARSELRDSFTSAGIGLCGANALIVSTGTTMLVTNEGNNRLSTSLPPVQIVVAGIDKLVPATADAMGQLRLLARSATGQTLTTYSTFIAGPRAGQSQYIVLIDNGRREMAADPWFESALSCIRCGACANVCPPYSVVGGHAFGHVYTGAIGLVNTAFHHGLEAVEGPQSLCVSCGACTTVCPADIPLAAQILKVRSRVSETRSGRSRVRSVALRMFQRRWLTRAGVGFAALVTRPIAKEGNLRLRRPSRHLAWRRAPQLPIRSARSRLRGHLTRANRTGSADVAVFLQCVTDLVAPEIAVATVKLLEAAGNTVVVPTAQHCCGLPALDTGERAIAVSMAKQTIETFETARSVVTPAASCAIALRHDYPELLADEPDWRRRAEALAARTFDLVTYLLGPSGIADGGLPVVADGGVTVHRFCQSTNVADLADSMDVLIERTTGQAIAPLHGVAECCGFGGSTSAVAPEICKELLSRKLQAVSDSGARVVITDNPGCLLHLRGGVAAADLQIEVLHVAEFLARGL